MADPAGQVYIRVVPKIDWMPIIESVPGLVEIIAEICRDEYERGRVEGGIPATDEAYVPFTESSTSTVRLALRVALNGR